MTSSPRPLDTLQALAAALARQAERYDQVLALSRRQQETAQASDRDLDQVLQLQQEKQRLFAAIAAADEALQPQKEAWAEVREQVDESAKTPLAEAVEQLRSIMQQVIEQEQQTEQVLGGCQQTVRQNLSGVQRQKSAASAYMKIQDEARFYDRKHK